MNALPHGLPLAREGLTRRVFYASPLGRVEELRATPFGLPPSGVNERPLFAHAFDGMFDFWRGRQHATFDSSRLLQLDAGFDYRERHPVSGRGHRALLFVPSVAFLEESPALQSAFGHLSRPVGSRMAMLAAQWRLRGRDPSGLDDLWCATMREIEGCRSGVTDSILVNRAKAYLAVNLSAPVSLAAIAAQLRVSPNHLTQSFTRAEGVPLYRYHLRLRLQRALERLPRCDDLTQLALDVGFSSHSHFSEAFRRHFGMTPSAYRSEMRSVIRAA